MSKKYTPMGFADAETYIKERNPGLDVSDFLGAEFVIYAELLKLHDRIDEIEGQAQEMMSPDKMMELAGNFMGIK